MTKIEIRNSPISLINYALRRGIVLRRTVAVAYNAAKMMQLARSAPIVAKATISGTGMIPERDVVINETIMAIEDAVRSWLSSCSISGPCIPFMELTEDSVLTFDENPRLNHQ